MTVRAKFRCDSVTERQTYSKNDEGTYVPTSTFDYHFSPVMAHNSPETDENKQFWKYSPSGKLELTSIRSGLFTIGKTYYLDFSETPQ